VAFFAAALATIISVVDPVGVAPLFLALTPTLTSQQRLPVMRRAIIVAGVILLAFAALGRNLLQALGISQPAFSIAGGILLMLVAVDMLFARTSRARETPEEELAAQTSTDVSVFPLAIPILSGPGAIATVVLYMSQAGSDALKIASVIAALLIALIASYVSMRLSMVLLRVLGQTGVFVVGRVLGILLAALAVQFVLNGVAAYYHHSLTH
jgi:multiple antibiotic resistance protein